MAIKPDIKTDFFFFDEIYKIDEDVAISSEDDVNDKIELGNDNPQRDEQDHRAVAFKLALYFLLTIQKFPKISQKPKRRGQSV